MRQDEIGKCAYFVVEGRLIVEREENGSSMILAEIGPRDLVGELAILDDAPRSATVIVAEDALLIPLNKHRIRSIIRRSPNIAELILKLLSAKLRNTHHLLTKHIDLSNATMWLKIGSLLSLCARAEQNPQARMAAFYQQLTQTLDAPPDSVIPILQRLEKTRLIKSNGDQLTAVNVDQIEPVMYQLKEEFVNEEIPEPTLAKEFKAIEVILHNCRPDPPGAPRMPISRQDLAGVLLYSNLWSKLHPTWQEQRVDNMIDTLIDVGLVETNSQDPDSFTLDLEMMRHFPKPEKELAIAEFVKSSLLDIHR